MKRIITTFLTGTTIALTSFSAHAEQRNDWSSFVELLDTKPGASPEELTNYANMANGIAAKYNGEISSLSMVTQSPSNALQADLVWTFRFKDPATMKKFSADPDYQNLQSMREKLFKMDTKRKYSVQQLTAEPTRTTNHAINKYKKIYALLKKHDLPQYSPYTNAPLALVKQVEIPLSPEKTFTLATDGIASWIRPIDKITWTNDKGTKKPFKDIGKGDARTCNYAGETVYEPIVHWDEGKEYHYLVDHAKSSLSFPIKNTTGIVKISPLPGGGSTLTWALYLDEIMPGIGSMIEANIIESALKELVKQYDGMLTL